MQRIDELLLLLKSEPGDQFLNYALALEYDKSGEKEKAISIIETLLQTDENYLGAYYKLGQLYEQIAQPAKAQAVYNKGIIIARKQGKTKTLGELNTALMLIEE